MVTLSTSAISASKPRPAGHRKSIRTLTAADRRRSQEVATWMKTPEASAMLRRIRDEDLIGSPIDKLRFEYPGRLEEGELQRFQADYRSRMIAYLRTNLDSTGDPPTLVMMLAKDHRFASANSLWLGDVVAGLKKSMPGYELMLPPVRWNDASWKNRETELFCHFIELERKESGAEQSDADARSSINRAAIRAAEQFNLEAAKHNALLKECGSTRPAVKLVSANTLRRVDKKPIAGRFVSNVSAIVCAMNLRKAQDSAWESAFVEWRSTAHGADPAALDHIFDGVRSALPPTPGRTARILRALDALDAARNELAALGICGAAARSLNECAGSLARNDRNSISLVQL